jgi:thioester reductase-like protein
MIIEISSSEENAELVPLAINVSNLEIENVFLTGAAGYLGIHLLETILKLTSSRVTCLLRGTSILHAKERLSAALVRYGLSLDWSRVFLVLGDLEKPHLGLEKDHYQELRKSIGLIIHAAADVSIIADYDNLRAINVDGVNSLIELASGANPIPLTHLSSYSVFNEKTYNSELIAFEQPLNKTSPKFRSGYARSKWDAEKLCERAISLGSPIRVLRLPYLLGASSTGFCNPKGQIELLLKAILHTTLAPDLDFSLNYLPINICAELVIRISLLQPNDLSIFHLTPIPSISWHQIIEKALDENFSLTLIPPDEWCRYIRNKALTQRILSPTAALISVDPSLVQFNSNIYRMSFDCRHLLSSLSGVCHSSETINFHWENYLKSVNSL